MRRTNRCGIKGVTTDRLGNYTAQIMVNGTNLHLGTYKVKEDAGEAYRLAAVKYFGEFARAE
jgi:hypothetical protein